MKILGVTLDSSLILATQRLYLNLVFTIYVLFSKFVPP